MWSSGGFLNDLIGRKTSLLLVDICVLIFGLLSAAQVSPDDNRKFGYPWLLICCFGVGFSSRGTMQVVTYYAEFLPRKRRGIWLVVIAMWWTVGAMFYAALAILVFGVLHLNWHWFLGLSASPMAIVLLLFPLVPESARFYLVKGKIKKAQRVIEKIAKFNCKKPLSGKLVAQEGDEDLEVTRKIGEAKAMQDISKSKTLRVGGVEKYTHSNGDYGVEEGDAPLSDAEVSKLLQESHESEHQTKHRKKTFKALVVLRQFTSLFENRMWLTTALLFFLWYGAAWSYYGVVILTTTMLSSDPHCRITNSAQNSSIECNELNTGDYVKILWASAAEFPGLILTFLIIDVLGRKKMMAVEFVMAASSFLLLLICTSKTILTVFLFIARAFVSGVFQVVYIYTPEVYPTEARALGLGVCNVAARVGGILTPVVAQVVFTANDYVSISLYAGFCIVFAILSMLLSIETKGRSLRDK